MGKVNPNFIGLSQYKAPFSHELGGKHFHLVMDDGSEIVFLDNGEGFGACSTDDDRIYMHAIAVLLLSPAEGIVYEDNSDPDLDAEMLISEGLDNVLEAKAVKEDTSIGFDFYATTVTLNEALEIVKIHQDFDVAQ